LPSPASRQHNFLPGFQVISGGPDPRKAEKHAKETGENRFFPDFLGFLPFFGLQKQPNHSQIIPLALSDGHRRDQSVLAVWTNSYPTSTT